jgi:hypothetical protein
VFQFTKLDEKLQLSKENDLREIEEEEMMVFESEVESLIY